MSHIDKITDVTIHKYNLSLLLVEHIQKTLKDGRWFDVRKQRMMTDLGDVVRAINGGYLKYRIGPEFDDYLLRSDDLSQAMIDGEPFLILKHFHVDGARMKSAIEGFLKTNLEEVEINHGYARTVFVSEPWETLRWCNKTYGGSKFKVTFFALKGVCKNVELPRPERVAA